MPERILINVLDIVRLPHELRSQTLSGRLDLTKVIPLRYYRQKPELTPFLAFKCDLLEAAMICDILRNRDREENNTLTKIVVFITEEDWQRIEDTDMLTIKLKGNLYLNPRVFSAKLPGTELKPPVKKWECYARGIQHTIAGCNDDNIYSK